MRLIIMMASGLTLISAVMIGLFLISSVPTKSYSLDLDPMKDEQSLFIDARVILTNNGKMPLTNLSIDYGPSTESIAILAPGEKISLSPPNGSNLDKVRVSANEGIDLTKDYRKPVKLPGMIGS